MNQEGGQGIPYSRHPLMAIYLQVWGSLQDPATKYKTILKTTHLLLLQCGRVHISKPSLKVQCDYSDQRKTTVYTTKFKKPVLPVANF